MKSEAEIILLCKNKHLSSEEKSYLLLVSDHYNEIQLWVFTTVFLSPFLFHLWMMKFELKMGENN